MSALVKVHKLGEKPHLRGETPSGGEKPQVEGRNLKM